MECGFSNNGRTCCQAARSRRKKQRFLSNEVICSTFQNNGKTKSYISAAPSCLAGADVSYTSHNNQMLKRHETDLIDNYGLGGAPTFHRGQSGRSRPRPCLRPPPSIKPNQPNSLCFQSVTPAAQQTEKMPTFPRASNQWGKWEKENVKGSRPRGWM